MIKSMRRNALILLLLFVAAVVSPAFGCLIPAQAMSSMACCRTLCDQPASSPQGSMQCCLKMAGPTTSSQQTMPAPARPVTVMALAATLAPAAHQLLVPRLAHARARDGFQRLSASPPLFELHSSFLI